ncbi:hypothetical protein [Halohasta salina]|uniref:hypothetical protein n=1 Tax=Halohasta salina TaxID=2961621 RepID=UPI0020A3AC18|nr:hypothetical protein [Halohasta salina]
MDDLEDIVEAVVDIEDIVEEVAEPAELIEDFVTSPVLIALALGAAIAAVVTALLVFATILFLVFAGPVLVVGFLAVVFLVLTLLAVAGFVYVRTDIPADVQRKIDSALERSGDRSQSDAEMTEQEAIEALKTRYATGELDEDELKRGLEDVLTSDRPERVVDRARSK